MERMVGSGVESGWLEKVAEDESFVMGTVLTVVPAFCLATFGRVRLGVGT